MGIRSKETYWRLHMGGRESREEERGKKEIGLVVSEWVDEGMPHIDVDPRVNSSRDWFKASRPAAGQQQ